LCPNWGISHERPTFLSHWASLAPEPLNSELRTLAGDAANDSELDERIEADYRYLGLWIRELRMTADTATVRLDPDQLRQLAELVAEHLRKPEEDRWYKTRAAAAYLGIHPDTLRGLAAKRQIRFEQERPGTALHFKRSWLDAYRSGVPT
jgi:excisionase family DNA binding protein